MKNSNFEKYLENLDSGNKLLEFEHFQAILDSVYNEITAGKGKQRHGQDTSFSQQPWKYITDGVGTGFAVGQAIKKLIEIKKYHDNNLNTEEGMLAWKREALGAVVYIIMAIMWTENQYIRTKEDIKDQQRT